jgi:hypothetical protein
MMKVFLVITEQDGETRKEDGETITKIEKRQYRYAALTMEQVWQWHNKVYGGMEEEIVTIHEEHPAIIVLNSD